MNPEVKVILERLGALGFETRAGDFSPFGQELRLVSGVAWEARTAQLAVIAEVVDESDDETWRQLLLATSGLRYHLGGGRPAAFGTPVVLAIVDDRAQRNLRDVAEDLAERFLVFSRVDLNLVHRSQLSDSELLDDALAPLLPRCRTLLAERAEISRADVEEFWDALVAEVHEVANGLSGSFGDHRGRAAKEIVDELLRLRGDDRELPAPQPTLSLDIAEFRSIRQTDFDLAPATVIYGPNGGGKSSLLEALELGWAGTSQRKPPEVPASEYQRHLPRNGGSEFRIRADGRIVTSVAEAPTAELARCVLTHEAVASLVSSSPEERYTALVETTGLELPDIAGRIDALIDDAKNLADSALAKAGIERLPRRNTVPLDHLTTALRTDFAKRLPPLDNVPALERTLSAVEPAYEPRVWPDRSSAFAALVAADGQSAQVLRSGADPAELTRALDDADRALSPIRDAQQAAKAAVDALLGAIRRTVVPASPDISDQAQLPRDPHPLPADVAIRWLAHSEALSSAAKRFANDAAEIQDPEWSRRLRVYSEAVEQLATEAPTRDLEAASRVTRLASRPHVPTHLDSTFFTGSGFSRAVSDPQRLIPHLQELAGLLTEEMRAIDGLAHQLRNHPVRAFSEHAPEITAALCRFDLARALKRTSPTKAAGERIVGRLLQGRLAPAVRELVASIVRFEWHFRPLIVPERGRTVVLGGLATNQADLDARLLLNSAERTVLGLAWFLGLHLLQPAERRQVLVLDDPTASFDIPNEAGFISTLRAFVRLTRPAQLVVATHSDATATIFAEQLAPVDGWPLSTARLRVQRTNEDVSVVSRVASTEESRPLHIDAQLLGLHEDQLHFPA